VTPVRLSPSRRHRWETLLHPAVERNGNDESVFVNPGEARTLSRGTRRSRLIRTSTFQLRAVSQKLDTPLAIRRGLRLRG
jgi:hypothetical protein